MTLRERFNRFWYHPTIDAMQAQMLREIPMIRLHRALAARVRDRINASLYTGNGGQGK